MGQRERDFDSHSPGVCSHTHTSPISTGTVEGDSPSSADHDIMEDQYKREELQQSSSVSVGAGTHDIPQSPRAGGGGQYHLGHPWEVFRHIQPLAIEQGALRNGKECERLAGRVGGGRERKRVVHGVAHVSLDYSWALKAIYLYSSLEGISGVHSCNNC